MPVETAFVASRITPEKGERMNTSAERCALMYFIATNLLAEYLWACRTKGASIDLPQETQFP